MKRNISIFGLSLIALASHAASGKEMSEENSLPSFVSGFPLKAQQYRADGSTRPLTDRLSISGEISQRNPSNTWQLELAPPVTAHQSDDPLLSRDKRVGVTFKRDF